MRDSWWCHLILVLVGCGAGTTNQWTFSPSISCLLASRQNTYNARNPQRAPQWTKPYCHKIQNSPLPPTLSLHSSQPQMSFSSNVERRHLKNNTRKEREKKKRSNDKSGLEGRHITLAIKQKILWALTLLENKMKMNLLMLTILLYSCRV